VKYFTVLFSIILLIFINNAETQADELPIPMQEEAPATVWDFSIGDSEVDLYLVGSWKMGIMAGVSVESGPSGIVFPAAFPGLTDFNFYQEPDLTISLWLMNRFYIETSFLAGFDKNTYAMGYRGMEGEVLQSVRIGNSEISIKDYKGLNVPSPKYNTPGVSASFQTPISYHDVLFRYDPTSEHKKVFLGEYEISEENISLDSYARGQFFILPDNDLDFIEVYIADKNGIYQGKDSSSSNEKKYRRATDNEAYYSLADGTVSLFEASETDVLVYYKKGGIAVGNVSLGKKFIPKLINGEPDPSDTLSQFSWAEDDTWYIDPPDIDPYTYEMSSAITVNGKITLKVYNPGKPGPFEYFNTYEINSNLPPDIWRTTVFLADNSLIEASDSNSYEFRLNIDDKLLNLYNQNENIDIRSPWSRYPLADSYPQIYGHSETDPGLTGRSILLSVKNQNGLSLGPGVIPGSEQISINGYETSSAIVDYSTGEVTFSRYIFPHDRIEISYRTETIDLSGGDLLFAQGNRFFPADGLELFVAEMFRWNITKKTSTTVDNTSPGGLTIAGGLQYTGENFNIELTSTLELKTPDTTGILRLQGMESSGFSFSIGEALLKQAPDSIWDTAGDKTLTNRANLIYKNYYSTNGLGQYFLNDYTWPGAVLDNSKEGPSVAAKDSGDTFDSNVMVMQYDVDGSKWSAGDLLLSPDGPIDLSRFTSLSMNFKKINTLGGDIVVKLLVGETGERDDWNSDGFVENEDESLIVEIPITLPVSDGIWSTTKYYFSPSEMKKLTKVRSIRVLIDDTSPAASGKLLVSGIHFEGSIFDHKIMDDGTNPDTEIIYQNHPLDILKVSEIDGTTAYGLANNFSEVLDIFHPAGKDQKALKIEWDLSSALVDNGDYWLIETNTSPVPADSYKNFSFYVKNDSIIESYEISLLDSQNRGYRFNYTPTTTGWEKLTLSLETGAITDSSGGTFPTATIDNAMGELSLFRVTSESGTTSGIMFIDELHYSDPTFSIDGNVELITDYNYDGPILTTISGFPIFANFFASNIFRYSGGSVLSTVTPGVNSIQNNSSLTFDLLMLSINANMKVNWNESSTDLSGSHNLQFPSEFAYGYISDNYSRAGKNSTSSVIRGNTIRFNVPSAGNINFSTDADGNNDILLQSWGGQTEWTIASLLKIGGSLIFEQNSLWDQRDQENYFSNWINDYNLIIPMSDAVNTRAVKSSLNFNLETRPVGFTLSPYLSFEKDETSLLQQTNRGGFQLSLPVRLLTKTGSEWSIIPSYSRDFMERSTKPPGDSFSDGFNNMFSDLGAWIPLTSFIPFHELFATSATEEFEAETLLFDEASFTPDFGIAFNRKFGSHIYDLFLPYNIDVHFLRNFGKKDDVFYNSNRFEFSYKQTAINLFGNFGVYPKFDFYNTDEFTSSLQFNLDVMGGNIPQPAELILQNYLSFYGNSNNVLSFENRFEADFIDTNLSNMLDFKFIWNRPMKDKFNLKFMNTLIDKEHFWSHEESLGLKFTHPWEKNDSVETTSININIKHLSKLTVPSLGALRTWLKLGFYGDEELFRTGFEAGLELEMSF
jgi:hypothetical protein